MVFPPDEKRKFSAATHVVGDAVGLSHAEWFVAIVKNNTEKSVSDKLSAAGYESYLPLQEEMHVWKNGRKAKISRVVIPSVVFVKCTEAERRQIVALPYVSRFMMDRASVDSSSGRKKLAVIPDNQIEQLKFMVGNSPNPVRIDDRAYTRGDTVRVIRGSLKGLQGVVNNIDEKNSELVLNIDFIGSARLVIETINVEKINPE